MRLVILAALAMAACSPADGEAPAATAPTETAAPAIGIEGEFVVTHVDGAPYEQGFAGHDPRVTIGPDRIHFRSQCIYADWTYVRQNGAIETESYFERGTAMCARGLTSGEQAVQDAFAAATEVGTSADGLVLSGGGRSVEVQRVVGAIDRQISAEILPGEYRVAGIDGREVSLGHAITLTITPDTIGFVSQCIRGTWAVYLEGERIAVGESTGEPVCERGHYPEEDALYDALPRVVGAVRTADNAVVLTGGGHRITLFSQ